MSELLHISGGPTKPEVIAISLSKLDLNDGITFYDVGCGTGAVSIEASKTARNFKVVAIDAREEAIEVARTNFRNFGIEDATLIHGKKGKKYCCQCRKDRNCCHYNEQDERAWHFFRSCSCDHYQRI
jgi:cobalt-precorrin-6B (C15)-methyltransferase